MSNAPAPTSADIEKTLQQLNKAAQMAQHASTDLAKRQTIKAPPFTFRKAELKSLKNNIDLP
ncbi:MAG: hypothetical protein JO011_06735 [Ktedonobacteraceae bacterium]|nr:hypothetical protein [Ktedonobacteraceae bacterium]